MNAINMNIQATRRTDIASRAMLVQLSVGQWTARKLDRKVSQDVAAQHKAKNGAGNYNKVLIARGNLAAIASVVADARADHATLSLPWLQDGTRIIPVDAYARYAALMQKHRERFETEVSEFCRNYPDYIAQAKETLGDMFNYNDYPAPADMARRFKWSVTVLPMPDAGDFRVDLDAETVAALQGDIADSVQDAITAAMGDAFERLHKVVKTMADKLAAYDPAKGKQGNPFRDSLVQNVRDIIDVLPSLNLTNDARLSDAIDRVRGKLVAHSAQDLREDDQLRDETAKEASAIADAMAGWMQ